MIFDIDKKAPGDIALTDESGRDVTYGDIVIFSEEFKQKMRPGCLIFCLCENSPESVLGYIGAIEAGSVPLLLGADIAPGLLENIFNIYHPSYIWCPGELNEKADTKGLAESSGGEGGRKDRRALPLTESFEEVFSHRGHVLYNTGSRPYAMNKELSLLLSTSGSTGSPKLVRLSRGNLESNASSIVSYLGIGKDERAITTLPMQYTYGLSVINSHLLAGARVLMTKSSIVSASFWEFFREYEATSLAGVPYTYSILKKLKFFKMDLPSLKTMTQAGGALPARTQVEYAAFSKKKGIRFFVMYGQTEATARMSYLPPERCEEKPGSIGIAISGGSFALTDDKGREISVPGKEGELIYKGPNVCLGYALCPKDLLKGDERGGVLNTGDIALFDEDGYYYIKGRKKRFLKVFGKRVGLDECEALLSKRFSGADFACTGRDDLIKIYTDAEGLIEEAADYLADALGINTKAIESVYVEKIARNAAGKVLYEAL